MAVILEKLPKNWAVFSFIISSILCVASTLRCHNCNDEHDCIKSLLGTHGESINEHSRRTYTYGSAECGEIPESHAKESLHCLTTMVFGKVISRGCLSIDTDSYNSTKPKTDCPVIAEGMFKDNMLPFDCACYTDNCNGEPFTCCEPPYHGQIDGPPEEDDVAVTPSESLEAEMRQARHESDVYG